MSGEGKRGPPSSSVTNCLCNFPEGHGVAFLESKRAFSYKTAELFVQILFSFNQSSRVSEKLLE